MQLLVHADDIAAAVYCRGGALTCLQHARTCRLRREIEIHVSMLHPNILRLHSAFLVGTTGPGGRTGGRMGGRMGGCLGRNLCCVFGPSHQVCGVLGSTSSNGVLQRCRQAVKQRHTLAQSPYNAVFLLHVMLLTRNTVAQTVWHFPSHHAPSPNTTAFTLASLAHMGPAQTQPTTHVHTGRQG